MIMCLLPDAATDPAALLPVLLEAAPRVVLEGPVAWLDVRGLNAAAVHKSLRLKGLRWNGGEAARPVVARVAAGSAPEGGLVSVAPGAEREFLAPHGLAELGLEDPLLGWLADVGIGRCGELAGVAREAVEVRFGAAAVQWWRWSRGDDERRLFAPVPPALPHASVDFIDYVVTDPERLIFTMNALLGGVCDQLREQGATARRLRLRLPLGDGSAWERTLKVARPTADRAAWLRLGRLILERITVPDAVTGMSVEVDGAEAAGTVQGDLFDVGFATLPAVENALARLVEDQGEVVRVPVESRHPLVELRREYQPVTLRTALAVAEAPVDAQPAGPVGLTLQLLPEPRSVQVETAARRDHEAPTRYRDGRWRRLHHAAGPDRISGGQWENGYAREYFRAVNEEGTLVWLFRDAFSDRWFLHGWWD
jgi:protein ImuB